MKMNLKPWLDRGDVQKIVVNEASLKALIRLIERDLEDCQIESLSLDRRFATPYGAALNTASYVIRKNGYRVSGKVGHHKITFDVAGEILGESISKFVDFFDICRRKRNKVDYDFADVVSLTEVDELISTVKKFRSIVVGNAR
jgi:hypothetical protein